MVELEQIRRVAAGYGITISDLIRSLVMEALQRGALRVVALGDRSAGSPSLSGPDVNQLTQVPTITRVPDTAAA